MKPTEPKLSGLVTTSIELVNNAINDLRNLSKILNSNFISSQTLSSLLQREIDVINHTQAFSMEFNSSGDEIPMPPEKQLVLFRIAQECLQNGLKHSKAAHISISLEYTPQECKLTIKDDGIGFLYDPTKLGNGFTNLRTRSSIIKADFNVHSQPGLGTLITVKVPLI